MSVMPADSTIRCPLSTNASSARLLFKGSYGNDTSFRLGAKRDMMKRDMMMHRHSD
jgi:hypothetical protein